MTATELVSLANQVLFVVLFGAVLWHAVRQPSKSSLNTVLLFGSIAMVVVLGRTADLLGLDTPLLGGVTITLLSVAPLAMIRLVDDFSGAPRWLSWLGALVFVGVAAVGFAFAFARTQPAVLEIVLLAWFVGIGGYAGLAFARGAARSRGITRRRMTAVAVGGVTFVAAIVTALLSALVQVEVVSALVQALGLTSGVSFFLGFAPPRWIRHAWREPDLRQFLQQSIHLTSVADERRLILDLQRSVADAFGATGCAIGIADEQRGVLRYVNAEGEWTEQPADAYIPGRAFEQQTRIVALDAAAIDPANADAYERAAATTVIAAPITLDDRRIGVLAVYASRSPVFIEDDLWLLELLADQIGVLLEARALGEEAASLRSREEAARLKEEFLSAAAHDLRTPLTVVLGQAELLQRRAQRDPTAPTDSAGVSRIVREARRLRDLVSQLLDVQRLEQGAAVMNLADADLRVMVTNVQQRFHEHGLDIRVVNPERPLIGRFDQMRLEQVLDNLIENALKYTTDGHLPEIHVGSENDEARIAVIDRGIGIPAEERDRVFDRFYRASNVQAITDTGMGLGLFICRQIVEAHGGRIWAEATPGGGSTIVVALPAHPPGATDAETEPSGVSFSGAEAAADA